MDIVSCFSLRFGLCDVSTVAECSVKNSYQVCWGWSLHKFLAALRDVQLSVGFSVSDMEYACLCLFWDGTQVVSSIVFANVVECVAEG